MNSKFLVRKALSMCLVIATVLTYSMVTLANSEKIAGEILVNGKNVNGQIPYVKVNGETAQSGRSIFSSSTISTPEDASVIVSIGKAGRIELAPNTTLTVSFDEKGISGDLSMGRVSVLGAETGVTINANGETVTLNVGESTSTTNTPQTDSTKDNDGGSAGLIWAVILGGAAVGIIFAATRNNNNITLGGGSTVISPTR